MFPVDEAPSHDKARCRLWIQDDCAPTRPTPGSRLGGCLGGDGVGTWDYHRRYSPSKEKTFDRHEFSFSVDICPLCVYPVSASMF